ncbi:uncharacterized protein E0L32_012366 [Thyridium curvatum]|uniref:C2H2-type domain-containing protein n=1 Tax=Thyridium curvatum TaxID=1093900 RepID=A0A507BIH6_9PEZI|nr:uncharacterized protein E0L32_012366 [Thyridium curvatum]TPX16801.1 hypothetical protein E0L32_012366 [Thyridium curvatum]
MTTDYSREDQPDIRRTAELCHHITSALPKALLDDRNIERSQPLITDAPVLHSNGVGEPHHHIASLHAHSAPSTHQSPKAAQARSAKTASSPVRYRLVAPSSNEERPELVWQHSPSDSAKKTGASASPVSGGISSAGLSAVGGAAHSHRPSSTATIASADNCYRASSTDPSFASHSPSLLDHSSPSPTPSPQPATPNSPSRDRANLLSDPASAQTKPKPIDIVAPYRSSSSRPPSAHILDLGHDNFGTSDIELSDRSIDMTTGPSLDSAMGRSRQDSFVSAGAKPISMINPNRESHRQRRESLAGSMMGGVSWGGLSVSSFIRDEIQMTGTSPYPAYQSPSFHSSSYIPKLEANFMRDFMCCDRVWPTMHDLLQHYEENHTQPNNNSSRNFASQGPAGQSVPRPSAGRGMNPGIMGAGQLGSPAQQGRPGAGVSGAGVGLGMSGLQQMMRQQQQSTPVAQKHATLSAMNDDMDTVGDMEMDDAVGVMDMDDSQRTIQQTRQMFGQQRPQLNLTSPGLTQQALRTSAPTTPAAASFGFVNNPTVSSVNTPTLTTQQGFTPRNQFSQDSPLTPGGVDADDDGQNVPMKMNFANLNLNGSQQAGLGFGNGVGGLDLNCIDDPAKSLFSPTNSLNASLANQQRLNQQLGQFGLDASQFPQGTDAQALLQQMSAALIIPQEEHKPYKCPVIGCEKAYKNQNGLKYHKTHGHATQQLHENGDGTFSIVNPETSAPYPGTMGMEKEKPFKCDTCGKRYKNLNGLKYHKQHSPQCDPELLAQQQALINTMAQQLGNQNGLNINFNGMNGMLPNIGEEAMQ